VERVTLGAMATNDTLRYPVGRLPRTTGPLDSTARAAELAVIEGAPDNVRDLVKGLGDTQLAASYRPGGWTVRQLVHHMADSHMNAYIRMKLAATEVRPAIKTYEEARWAELPEAKTGPIEMSLALLDALHARWVAFIRALDEDDLRRVFVHPEWGDVTIDESLMMYAWHCRHHTAHIEIALGKR
jgi:uncharacterized damage-inducible protein DinB